MMDEAERQAKIGELERRIDARLRRLEAQDEQDVARKVLEPRRDLVARLEQGAAAIAASGQGDPDPPRGELARLEVRTAERDRALDLLAALERIVTRIGGYMTHDDQADLRDARALLVELGRREPEDIPVWRDRG